MFQHFLITRFNLRQHDWTASKNNIPVLTDAWHENRFKLFTQFCFPSVMAQKNTNFQWLVFFDSTTPPKYRKIIDDLKIESANFIPIFVKGMGDFLPGIQTFIKESNKDYIITSRLDNDDCISRSYVDEIQKRFDQQDFMALDFLDGYTIQLHPLIKVAKRFDQFNPFISLIEKNINPKSVWFVNKHSHWKRETRIQQVRGVRTWASIIHNENKKNRFYGFGDAEVESCLEDFGISDQQKDSIATNLVPVSEWKYQSLSNLSKSYWNYSFKNMKKYLGIYKFR